MSGVPPRVSAFAALNSSNGNIGDEKELRIKYEKRQDESEEDDDDDDDDDDEDDDDDLSSSSSVSLSNSSRLITPLAPLQIDFGTQVQDKLLLIRSSKLDMNTVQFFEDCVTFELRDDDYLILKGKYKFVVEKGTIMLDSVVINSNESEMIEVNATSLGSLPTIYTAKDTCSTVKVINWFDGSEKIGHLYPQLKRVYCDDENLSSDDPSSDLFRDCSFRAVLSPSSGDFGTTIPVDWHQRLDELVTELGTDNPEFRALLIGGKNSGKSTFLRILLNRLLSAGESVAPKVHVLDLDPGQTEYSNPDSISLTEHTAPIFGMHFPFRNSAKQDIQTFLGFNNPQRQPMNYMSQMQRLIDNIPGESSVLINTPGWIKGFGIQIFKKLTEELHITHLIFFSNSDKVENDQHILSQLRYDRLIRISGFHIPRDEHVTRYSSSQIRHFKTLSYFHYSFESDTFNFAPLLQKSPYRLSYTESDQVDIVLKSPAISLIALLDANRNINPLDIPECLEFQTVGIFVVKFEELQSIFTRLQTNGHLLHGEGFPNIALDCVSLLADSEIEFRGLGLVHSIDREKKLLNIYTPMEVKLLSEQLQTNNYKLLLIKGRSEYPVEEIYPLSIYLSGDRKRRFAKPVPYVSFNTDIGKGGKAVSVRRNIQRRGLHN
ncbi:DEKNAAC101308 [Brettanomyces naardenensis]|uniref:Polynucleotide 5'-hydroxyl-kinase GRC3 n=1 Tax=Brettanomyces naardenensis TaxID=13370 RepID=A0A448YHU1_BRENA|nr:DEKNAAC101308 [Brettanomyces naardenensis]